MFSIVSPLAGSKCTQLQPKYVLMLDIVHSLLEETTEPEGKGRRPGCGYLGAAWIGASERDK